MSVFDHQLTEQQLDSLYNWVDGLPLSRPKKNISRDFSDGVLMAEVVSYYYPKLIELHNYNGANSIKAKISNWKTLSSKVLSKFGFTLRDDQCQKLASAVPSMIESLLYEFKNISAEQHRQKQQYNNKNSNNLQQNNRENNREGEQRQQQRTKQRQTELKGLRVTKVEELKEILKLLKQKISFVEKNIQRKDAEIKQLQDIIQLGL